jgi:hypothetical protein
VTPLLGLPFPGVVLRSFQEKGSWAEVHLEPVGLFVPHTSPWPQGAFIEHFLCAGHLVMLPE